MSYKTYVNPKAFGLFATYGIAIPTLSHTANNFKNGLLLGSMNLVGVLFGLFAVKHVNIPLFLTFRRCNILATVLMTYIVESKLPTATLAKCTAIMVLGGIVAGYESFDDNLLGYVLIWSNNFANSVYGVFTNKYNQDKKLTPFEINFYFALIGLPLSLAVTIYQGELVELYDAVYGDKASLGL